MEGIDYSPIETKVVVGDDVLEAGLAIAASRMVSQISNFN
jgi:hypothetical protein